jgi:hypothetical protein
LGGWRRHGGGGSRAAWEAEGLDAGGGAADQAGKLEVEEGGVQGGGCEVGGGGQAAQADELAVDQRGQDRPGGRVETGPGLDGRGGAGGRGGAELLEDVGEAADQGGAVADELVASGGARVPGSSREDEDVPEARLPAARAVDRLPESSAASTTTTAADRAAITRFRGRKWAALGGVASGCSLASVPPAARTRANRPVLARG